MEEQYLSPQPNKAMKPEQFFLTASFVCGLLAIVSTIFVPIYLPFLFGGLGIIFAFLSRRIERPLAAQAKTGILLSVIGVVVNLLLLAVTCFIMFTNTPYHATLNEACDQLYGETFDQMWDDMTAGTELEGMTTFSESE